MTAPIVKPDEIVLRFVRGNDVFSDGIVLDTGGNYSHVECVTPEGKFLGALSDGGVQARAPGYDAGQIKYDWFVPLPVSINMASVFYADAEKHIGEPYDFAAIAGFVAHMNLHEKGCVICSAFQTLRLIVCRWFAKPLVQPPHEISPRDLLLIISGRVPLTDPNP